MLQVPAIHVLDDLLPLFPAPALQRGLCTTSCWAGIHPSKADIERDCQTGPAQMHTMHSSSREQHFERPLLASRRCGDCPTQACWHSCPREQAQSPWEHRVDNSGRSKTCCVEDAALPLGAAMLWPSESGPLRTPVQPCPASGEALGVPKRHLSPPASPSPGGLALTAARGFNFPRLIKVLLKPYRGLTPLSPRHPATVRSMGAAGRGSPSSHPYPRPSPSGLLGLRLRAGQGERALHPQDRPGAVRGCRRGGRTRRARTRGGQASRKGGDSGRRAGRSLFPETPLQGAAGEPPRAGDCSPREVGTCAAALPPGVSHGGAPAPSSLPGERGGGSNQCLWLTDGARPSASRLQLSPCFPSPLPGV